MLILSVPLKADDALLLPMTPRLGHLAGGAATTFATAAGRSDYVTGTLRVNEGRFDLDLVTPGGAHLRRLAEDAFFLGDPVSVEIDGKKIWTCCDACPPKLKANPAKYLGTLQVAPPPKNSVLSVPESAVIDTGALKLVYVEAQPGVYEGRRVVLGPRSGDRFPVLDGLTPGEKVVAAGAFLVDAETRLNPATRGGAKGDGPASPANPTGEKPAAVASGHVHSEGPSHD